MKPAQSMYGSVDLYNLLTRTANLFEAPLKHHFTVYSGAAQDAKRCLLRNSWCLPIVPRGMRCTRTAS